MTLRGAALHSTHEATRLPRYLGIAYLFLTACACLSPFDEFRGIAGSPLEFLIHPWPRYFSLLDAIFNVLGFAPAGFLLLAAQNTPRTARRAIWRATLQCALFSFGLEFCQNYLVERVASNLDLACNTLGGAFGAALGLYGRRWLKPGGFLHAWRMRRLPGGRRGELGILLVLAWWLTQSAPLAPLFSNGDLRPVFDLVAPISFSVERFVSFEAASVACGLLAIGLFLRCGLREPSPWLVGLLILIGLGSKTLAAAWFVTPPDPWLWATPGTSWGLGVGALLLALCWRLPAPSRHALANLAMLLATVLVNLAPGNPFEEATQHVVRAGHFVGLYRLTLTLALIWPFFALSWLALTATRR